MVKILLMGAGYCANVHAMAYSQIKNAKIVAFVDRVEAKAKEKAGKYGGNWYTDFDEALEKEECDIVDICIPIYKHCEFALKAVSKGKNIFIEKPITLSVTEADKIIEAVEKKNVNAMVGHCVRFWPQYVKAREIAQGGELGKILYVYSERHLSCPTWLEENWAFNEEYSGGAAVDLHCHDLDYLNWVLGEPRVVKSQGVYNPNFGGFIQITTSVEFENGAVGMAQGGWAYQGEFPFTAVVRILCEHGTIDWMLRAGTNIEERENACDLVVYKEDGTTVTPVIEDADPYYSELAYMVDCVENNKPIERCTLVQAKDAVKICLAARKSAKEKTVVTL